MRCAACDAALFRCEAEFDSGTGWPGFADATAGALGHKDDSPLQMRRTELHCACCSGHHGHVFDDGPAPAGRLCCSNSSVPHVVPDRDAGPSRPGSSPGA